MTQAEPPKIVKKKLFSPIWLLPLVALALGGWLGVKSLREQGIEIEIHFPSASGIDVGKTLVRYQGLNIGKVVDIGLDSTLTGVDVKVLMDYRAQPFLKSGSKFWLVTPKASITGVEGLDALFSGNYIAVQPGDGNEETSFVALQEAPAIQPGESGVVVELKAQQLGSVDVGSKVFYRQIPVGDVVSYKLEQDQSISISAFIKEQYAYLVKTNSRFWNVSGLTVDASLNGLKIQSESLSALLAGGIAFSSDPSAEEASHNTAFNLYEDEDQALGGVDFTLTTATADNVSKGGAIQFRGIQVGEVLSTELTHSGVAVHARLFTEYRELLAADSQFYLQGADISLDGIKHASRLVTGPVIELIPGTGPAAQSYALLDARPEDKGQQLTLKAFSRNNPGLSVGAAIKYKAFDIGTITSVKLAKDFSGVEYQLDVPAQFSALFSHGSYLYGQSALEVNASLEGVSVKTSDAGTLLKGSLNLVRGKGRNLMTNGDSLTIYPSQDDAKKQIAAAAQRHITLKSLDGASVSQGSPVYFKKMQVGQVADISWSGASQDFDITLDIDNTFASLLTDKTVFWQNSAVEVNAGLSGVDVKVAPLQGALKGSISLGQLDQVPASEATQMLYSSEQLAMAQAKVIELTFPADAPLKAGADIRFKGYQIGEIEQIALSDDLSNIKATAWLYGQYAQAFQRQDSQYYLVNAQVSLAGIKAPETLLTGPYVAALPGKSELTAASFNGKLQAGLYGDTASDDLKITLVRPALGSIKPGTPVLYRGIHIGEVKGFDLTSSGQQVQIYLAIESGFRHLINRSSKFWDYSGIKVDFGLLSGAKVETGSVENILAGGIAVATKDTNTADNQLKEHAVLPLYNQADEDWQEWSPALN